MMGLSRMVVMYVASDRDRHVKTPPSVRLLPGRRQHCCCAEQVQADEPEQLLSNHATGCWVLTCVAAAGCHPGPLHAPDPMAGYCLCVCIRSAPVC